MRETKLDLFSEQMDSYVNSVLELFHFVVDEDEGMVVARLLLLSRREQHRRQGERQCRASRHQQHVQNEGNVRKRDLQRCEARGRSSDGRGCGDQGDHQIAA